MKQVVRYKCGFCKRERATVKGMETHEKRCIHNPECFNCFMCEHASEEESEGYYHSLFPYCDYYEENILTLGNISETCSAYKRTDKLYSER